MEKKVFNSWLKISLASLSIALVSSGCVVEQIGQTVQQTVKGDYYLKAKKTEEGRQSFRQEVKENPQSPLAHYYYGRFLLQDGKKKEALAELQRAAKLDPANADYQFWAGLAAGENGDKKQEESRYRAALKLDAKHLQSLTYYGHLKLESGKYTDALNLYTRALAIWPASPSSLYNRALIMKKLGRTPEEQVAWLQYLEHYPSGAMARRAVDHLNQLDDFSYRNYQLGARNVTTEKIWFEPLSATLSKASNESLTVIGAIVENSKAGSLQIVAFQKNNKDLAHKRALAVKHFLLENFPGLKPGRIGVSWFAEPEQLVVNRKKLVIDESISFFITPAR